MNADELRRLAQSEPERRRHVQEAENQALAPIVKTRTVYVDNGWLMKKTKTAVVDILHIPDYAQHVFRLVLV
jgi:hypothetical protein